MQSRVFEGRRGLGTGSIMVGKTCEKLGFEPGVEKRKN